MGVHALELQDTRARRIPASPSPEDLYDSPVEIGRSDKLSADRKLELLTEWEQSVRQRLDATSEGMPPNGTSYDDLGLIERIEHVRKRVERSAGAAMAGDAALWLDREPGQAPFEAPAAGSAPIPSLDYGVFIASAVITAIASTVLVGVLYAMMW